MSATLEDVTKSVPYCSFCGKTEAAVQRLVAGPHSFVCDECIELCMTIVRDDSTSFHLRSAAEYRKLAEESVRAAKRPVSLETRLSLRSVAHGLVSQKR